MRSAVSLFVAASLVLVAFPCGALQKTAVRMTDADLVGGWTAVGTCSVVYYNTCTGWIWLWGDWWPGDVIGTCYDTDSCGGPGELVWLLASVTYFRNVLPAGYGCTGTIAIQRADANMCPTAVLASAPMLPALRWNINNWGIEVPSRFVVTYEFGPQQDYPYVRPATDHPAAGPTGPAACSYCFPTTRVARSFYYGTASSPLCPGSAFNDGVCDANLLGWVWLNSLASVDESSWGGVKSLYR